MFGGCWLLRVPSRLAWCCYSLDCGNIFTDRCHTFLGQRISCSRLSGSGEVQCGVVGIPRNPWEHHWLCCKGHDWYLPCNG